MWRWEWTRVEEEAHVELGLNWGEVEVRDEVEVDWGRSGGVLGVGIGLEIKSS